MFWSAQDREEIIITQGKVYLQCLENIIFISCITIYLCKFTTEYNNWCFFLMKCYNYTIEVIKIYVTNLIIKIFTLTSI